MFLLEYVCWSVCLNTFVDFCASIHVKIVVSTSNVEGIIHLMQITPSQLCIRRTTAEPFVKHDHAVNDDYESTACVYGMYHGWMV